MRPCLEPCCDRGLQRDSSFQKDSIGKKKCNIVFYARKFQSKKRTIKSVGDPYFSDWKLARILAITASAVGCSMTVPSSALTKTWPSVETWCFPIPIGMIQNGAWRSCLGYATKARTAGL